MKTKLLLTGGLWKAILVININFNRYFTIDSKSLCEQQKTFAWAQEDFYTLALPGWKIYLHMTFIWRFRKLRKIKYSVVFSLLSVGWLDFQFCSTMLGSRGRKVKGVFYIKFFTRRWKCSVFCENEILRRRMFSCLKWWCKCHLGLYFSIELHYCLMTSAVFFFLFFLLYDFASQLLWKLKIILVFLLQEV